MEPGSSAQYQERNRTASVAGKGEALVSEEDDVAGRCSDAVKRVSPRPLSPWQRRLTLIISHDWFDNAVVGFILVNCVLLVLEDSTREVSVMILSCAGTCGKYKSIIDNVDQVSCSESLKLPVINKLQYTCRILLMFTRVYVII